MKKLHLLPLIVSIALLAPLAWAQSDDGFSSFEERMTGREFTEAGLHKLSEEELAALNAWVRNRSLAGSDDAELQRALAERAELEQALARAEAGGGSARGGREQFSTPEETFTSSIVGSFSGWTGETEFELENGMVWQQIGSDTLSTRRMENPSVTLRPGVFGGWTLQVEGYNKRTRVRRIR